MDDDKKVRRDDSRREEEVWRASECCCCFCWIFLAASSVDGVVDVVVVAEAVHSTNVDKGAYKALLERVAILPLPLSPPPLLVLPMLLIVHTSSTQSGWW